MQHRRKTISALQRLAIGLAISNRTAIGSPEAYYCEILAELGWQAEDMRTDQPLYIKALRKLDRDCDTLEREGIVTKMRDKTGTALGVVVTDSGEEFAASNGICQSQRDPRHAEVPAKEGKHTYDGVKQILRQLRQAEGSAIEGKHLTREYWEEQVRLLKNDLLQGGGRMGSERP